MRIGRAAGQTDTGRRRLRNVSRYRMSWRRWLRARAAHERGCRQKRSCEGNTVHGRNPLGRKPLDELDGGIALG